MTSTLLVPVLNEMRGLPKILGRLPPVEQVLIVDGGSTDGSLDYCRERGWEVVQQTGPGLRQAFLDAWPSVTGDVVITFSPDGNSDPGRIPALVDAMHHADMVIVSRYLNWARSDDDTPLTRAANWGLTRLINLAFGGHYTDALVMFRAYRREVPGRLGILDRRSPRWERTVGRYISWEPMLSIRAAKAGLRVAEIPGDEPPRIGHGRPGFLLPESRIQHFRCGWAFLRLIAEERWRSETR